MAVTGTPPQDIEDSPLGRREEVFGQPPKQPPPKPKPTPITWFWHGFNWHKATECNSDGSLAIGINCTEVDGTAGFLSNPVTSPPTAIPNTQYPFTLTQSATPSMVNGYQLPWGIVGGGYMQPNVSPGSISPTGMGPQSSYCCSIPYPALAWGSNKKIILEFNLQDAFGNFLPMDPTVSNGCSQGNPTTGGWTCSALGNNHFRYTMLLTGWPWRVGFSGFGPDILDYSDLSAGTYTFNWDSISIDLDGNGLVAQTISNSSADFVVEADPICKCMDTTNAFNQMPYAYQENCLNLQPTTYSYHWSMAMAYK
jgi:hypothetical protein